MKKVVEIVCFLLGMLAVWIFLKGGKAVFSSEKVYLEESRKVFHTTQYCDLIKSIDASDREYMEETGNLIGTTEKSERECYNDVTLSMCKFCYSPMDRKYRNEYLSEVRRHQSKSSTK